MKNSFFSLKRSEFLEENSLSDLFVSKYLNKHYLLINSLPDDLLRLPSDEEMFFLQTNNSLNAFTFIQMIAKNQKIKELYISICSIDSVIIEALKELHEKGYVDAITMLISDRIKNRNPIIVDMLTSLAKSKSNIALYFCKNHSKVCLMKTEYNCFVLEGSGNWSQNAMLEQYLFINSKPVYEFRKKIFTESKLI